MAGLLLTTEVMIAEGPKDEDHGRGGGGGGMPGGMGGMDIGNGRGFFVRTNCATLPAMNEPIHPVQRQGLRRMTPARKLALVRKSLLVLVAATLIPCAALAQRRMAPIPADRMTPEQKAAADTFKAARGYELKDHVFMDLLRVPDAMLAAFRMREHVRTNSTFGGPLTEFALLLTLREWSQPQEWSGHVSQAVAAGIKGEVIAAVAEGRYPDGMTDDESIIYHFTTELLRNHSVSDASYERMVKRWGEAGVIEAIQIAGLYTIVGMVLNTAREPIPERYNELPAFPQLKPVPLSTYTHPVSLFDSPPGAPTPAKPPVTTPPAK